jgi:hypothetical protein
MTSTVGITTTAADAGLAHFGFVHADAQTQRVAPLRFDAIVRARADVFADPDARFTNLAARSGPTAASRSSAARSRAACTRC